MQERSNNKSKLRRGDGKAIENGRNIFVLFTLFETPSTLSTFIDFIIENEGISDRESIYLIQTTFSNGMAMGESKRHP